MPSGRPARAGLLAWAIALVALALLPSPVDLARNVEYTTLELPLDPSLRVPLPSLFLSLENRPLSTGSYVDQIRFEGSNYRVQLGSRSDLQDSLRNAQGMPAANLYGRDGEGSWSISAPLHEAEMVSALSQQWTVLLASGFYILVGLLMLAGGKHPVAPPVTVLSLCVGFGLLSTIDQVLPGFDGPLHHFEVRARIGLLAWSLLPPSLLHLAMRFPVVAERFRSPGIVGATYALGLCLVILGQLRFHDAATLDAIEKLSFSLALLSAIALIWTSLSQRRRLSPIESARARALAVGLWGGWLGPIVVVAFGISPRPWMSEALTLGTLALPIALAWSVLRYHLIDPASWTVRHLRSAGVFLVSFLLACGVIWGANLLASPVPAAPPQKLFATALVTIALYHLCRRVTETIISRSIPTPASPHTVVSDAIPRLVSARSSEDAYVELEQLTRRLLGSSAAEIRAIHPAQGDTVRGSLWQRGADAWARIDPTAGRRVHLLNRDTDPGPDQPEVLLAIEPIVGPPHLLVASARSDGLPYSESDVEAFQRLAELVEMAVPAAVRATELESLVSERTLSLERTLQLQASVLVAAEALLDADSDRDARQCVMAFVERIGIDAVWREVSESERTTVSVDSGSEIFKLDDRWLLAVGEQSPSRLVDVRAQLSTVIAFARLALARISAMSGLRQEIREKSDEVARVTATAYQAQFVRNLAHELRKPVEEAESLAARLERSGTEEARARATRIKGICVELQRRLDTLLGQNGVRLDLQAINLATAIDSAVARAGAIEIDREYVVEHDLDPLPVIADPARLRALVENLIDNATKATQKCGKITVRSGIAFGEETSRHVPSVFIEVEDDGVGIEAGLEESIFEQGVSTFPGGFGLGLSLCRATARAHGGSMRAIPTPTGALLRVILPQHPPSLLDD
jgi:signal transduction histidine kinase